MAVTANDVKAIAPELANVDPSVFDTFIADSALAYDLNAYPEGATRDYIQKNLVAFMMLDAGVTGAGGSGMHGPLTSESAGGVTRSFGSMPTTASTAKLATSELARNRYGQAVLRYRRRFALNVGVA